MLPDWPPFIEVGTEELISEGYQRPVDPKRVKKMVEKFDIKIFGALTVADVEGGNYAVIDGQHRHQVAIEKALETVWVQLHESLSYKQRAQMFVDIQTSRKGLTAVERFRGQVEAGVGRAVDINRMIEEAGLKLTSLPPNDHPYTIRAIVGLERLYHKRREVVPKTLYVANSFPSVSENRTSNYIVRGIGLFLIQNPEVDHKKLAEALSEQEANPNALLDVAQELTGLGGESGMTNGVRSALEGVWSRYEGGRRDTTEAAKQTATA